MSKREVASQMKDPYLKMTNLSEVVTNKTILSGAGWIDGKWLINGRSFSNEEVHDMFPTTFIYKAENPDGTNIPR